MKCIIVDDEPIARRGIKALVESIPQLTLQSSFNSAESASEYIGKTNIDLIFLDIQMGGISGIDFAKTVPKNTLIIFTTAYSEYAFDSYQLEAIDYLLKPIDPVKFRRAVNKALTYHSLLSNENDNDPLDNLDTNLAGLKGDDYFFVKSDRKFCKIKYEEILFVMGLKDYIVIHLKNNKVVTRISMKNIELTLSDKKFIRVNRSYIVNRDYIDSFDNNDIYIGEYTIPIGNSYRDNITNQILAR